MNKIFKVIWNHAAQRFDVVSELTKSNGKSSSTTDNRIEPSKALLAIGAVGVAGFAVLGSTDALAATATAITVTDTSGATQNLYVDTSVADNSIAIGGGTGFAREDGSPLTNATAAVGGIAIGSTANAGEGSIAMSYRSNASGGNAISIGYTSAATGGTSIAMGLIARASALESVAIGREANSSGQQSLAIGTLAKSQATYTTSMG